MKLTQILLYFSLLFGASNLNAQKVLLWLDAGVKAGYGPGMLYNADILNSSEGLAPKINGNYSVGGKLGFNFGEYYAITIDGMYAQSQNKFTYTPDQGSGIAENHYKWSSLDIYPLFRYNRTINYVEVGPKISYIQNVRQANNTSSFSDVSNDFNSTNVAAVLGFGWYAAGDDAFTAIIGFRIDYGITDFVSTQGYTNDQIKLGLVEGNATTNPAMVQLVFELNWGLGYYAKTVCGGRSRFYRF